jgi:hypothetical protein
MMKIPSCLLQKVTAKHFRPRLNLAQNQHKPFHINN